MYLHWSHAQHFHYFLIQLIISALRSVIAFITANQYFIFDFASFPIFSAHLTNKSSAPILETFRI